MTIEEIIAEVEVASPLAAAVGFALQTGAAVARSLDTSTPEDLQWMRDEWENDEFPEIESLVLAAGYQD